MSLEFKIILSVAIVFLISLFCKKMLITYLARKLMKKQIELVSESNNYEEK